MTARILGIGAVTSLGDSWQKTVSGLDNRQMGLVRERRAISIDGLPMTLAPVWPLHDIHNPLERLARLMTGALRDLTDQGLYTGNSVRISLCLPAWVQQGRHGDPMRERLSERLTMPADMITLSYADQTSILDLAFAAQQGSLPQILIVADTYLLAELLDNLTAADRILSRYQPHGLVPSEAAVALFVAPDASGTRGYIVKDLQRAIDPTDLRRSDTLFGETLAGLAREVLTGAELPQRFVCDLNGERWRSEEIAFVISRSADRLPAEALADIEAPASQTGYCGAAMAGIILALACRDTGSAAQGRADSLLLISQFDGTRIAARVTGNRSEDA